MQESRKRMYQDFWERIKQRNRLKLQVKPLDYPKLKQGIIKEKNRDIGFKILNDHGENFRLRFTYDREGMMLLIELRQPLGIEEKVV